VPGKFGLHAWRACGDRLDFVTSEIGVAELMRRERGWKGETVDGREGKNCP